MKSTIRSTAAAVAVLLAGVAGLTACARTEPPVAVVQADDDGFHGTLVDPPLRPANVVLWPVAEAAELAYWLGHKPACTIVRQGRVVRDALGVHG